MASSYPTGLDSLPTTHVAGEAILASTVNNIADATNKIEAALGTSPQRTYSTVSARLDAMQFLSFNIQTGTTYTLTLSDQDKIVGMQNASANTLTVPTNASVSFPTGVMLVVKQNGAGQTTIIGASGVTIRSRGSATKLAGQYAYANLVYAGGDTWDLTGDITT